MLGTIRFLLAFCVIAFHLTAKIPNLGLFAVNFFYVISGFLITLVLNETYKFSLINFAINRFLRLYPAYYFIATVGFIFTLIFTEYFRFHPSWSNSLTLASLAGNLLIFPWAFLGDDIVSVNFLQINFLQSSSAHFRLVPSTWSVGVEIVCYFILWIFTARKLWTAAITIAFGAAWQVYVYINGLNAELNYFPVPAAMLPFALGSLAYHLGRRFGIGMLSSVMAKLVTIVVVVLFVLNWRMSTFSEKVIGSFSYYANTVLAFAAVTLINRTRHSGVAWKFDKWLGDLAYPIFLGHYVLGFIAWEILGTNTPARGWQVFFLGSIVTVAASIVVVVLVDLPIVNLRERIRKSIRH